MHQHSEGGGGYFVRLLFGGHNHLKEHPIEWGILSVDYLAEINSLISHFFLIKFRHFLSVDYLAEINSLIPHLFLIKFRHF